MFLVFLHWFFLWLSLPAVGYLFIKLFIKKNAAHSYFFYLWLGYAILTAYLQTISLFFALNHWLVFTIWLFLTIFGFKKVFKKRSLFNKRGAKKIIILLPFALIILVSVAFSSTREVFHYDSYLYQFSMVAWNKNFPAMPGLANIHERLGFNSSFLAVAAFVETFLTKGMSAFILNGFLVATLMVNLVFVIAKKDKNTHPKYFALLVMPLLIKITLSGDLASLATDIPIYMFSTVLILFLLTERNYFFLILISVLIPTIKFSGGASAVVLIACLFFIDKKMIKDNLAYLILIFILGFSFVMRNYIISGYPLFPLNFLSINLPWQVDSWIPLKISRDVTAWARFPGPQYIQSLLKPWSFWLPSWFSEIKKNLEFLIFLFSILLLVLFRPIPKINHKQVEKVLFNNYLPLLYSLFGILYWFLMAPDPRFGLQYFWILLAIVLIESSEKIIRAQKIRTLILSSFSLLLLAYIFNKNFYIDFNQIFDKDSYFLITSRYNQVNQNQLGFIYYTPTYQDHCGNEEFICLVSSGLAQQDRLQFREPNNILKGFEVVEINNYQ